MYLRLRACSVCLVFTSAVLHHHVTLTSAGTTASVPHEATEREARLHSARAESSWSPGSYVGVLNPFSEWDSWTQAFTKLIKLK